MNVLRRIASLLSRIVRAVGREIAATIRLGGPAAAVYPATDWGLDGNPELGVVAGITMLRDRDEPERRPPD